MPELIVPPNLERFPEISSCMSVRTGGVSGPNLGMNLSFKVGDESDNVRANRGRFFTKAGFSESSVAFAEQCHSATVRVVDKPGIHSSCDGLISHTPGLGLAVTIADCVPVLLFDPPTHSIAAVHAGWRGSVSKILGTACRILSSELGLELQTTLAYIGPAAGRCCYEVGDDVARRFRDEVRTRNENKQMIDLKLENKFQLLESGVPEENIVLDDRCTICGSDVFHSYRRDGEKSGRMIAFIGLRGD